VGLQPDFFSFIIGSAKMIFTLVKTLFTSIEMDETYNIWMKFHLFIQECTIIQNRAIPFQDLVVFCNFIHCEKEKNIFQKNSLEKIIIFLQKIAQKIVLKRAWRD